MVLLRQIGRFQASIKFLDHGRVTNVGIVKSYSVFPRSYQNPTFLKQEQKKLEETGEIETLAHVHIRPALGAETSSEFYDPIVHKFTKYIMRKGKKQLARSLMEAAFERIKRTQLERYHKTPLDKRDSIILDPVDVLHKAIDNVTPIMSLIPTKKGGSTYQVPVPIERKRQLFMGMNWLIKMANNKEASTRFHDVLAKELIDAANNRGRVVKQKQDHHKQCEANRAYAHFRWS